MFSRSGSPIVATRRLRHADSCSDSDDGPAAGGVRARDPAGVPAASAVSSVAGPAPASLRILSGLTAPSATAATAATASGIFSAAGTSARPDDASRRQPSHATSDRSQVTSAAVSRTAGGTRVTGLSGGVPASGGTLRHGSGRSIVQSLTAQRTQQRPPVWYPGRNPAWMPPGRAAVVLSDTGEGDYSPETQRCKAVTLSVYGPQRTQDLIDQGFENGRTRKETYNNVVDRLNRLYSPLMESSARGLAPRASEMEPCPWNLAPRRPPEPGLFASLWSRLAGRRREDARTSRTRDTPGAGPGT